MIKCMILDCSFFAPEKVTITNNNLRKILFYTSELNHHTFLKAKTMIQITEVIQ